MMSIVREREYGKYIAATILTSIGTGMQFVALTWYLYSLTNTAASVGLLLIISTLPGIFFSPWVGMLVDTWDARSICIGTDVARALIFFALALLISTNYINLAGLYVSVLLASLCDNFFQPAASVLVRQIVDRKKLLAANTASSMSMQIGVLAGASIAGILIAHFGTGPVILVNAISFVVSAVLTRSICRTQSEKEFVVGEKINYLAEFRASLLYIKNNHQLAWMVVLQIFVYLTLYSCNTLLPAFVDKELALGASAFGLIDASWGAGALVGGAMLAHVVRFTSRRAFVLAGMVLLSSFVFMLVVASSEKQAMTAYFFLGCLITLIKINSDTIILSEVETGRLGRIKAIVTMFVSYMGLAVYAGVGCLGDIISTRAVFLIIGILLFIGFAVAALPNIGYRSMRTRTAL